LIVLLQTLGYVLLGGIFVWAGIEHFLKFKAVSEGMTARGLPAAPLLLAAGSVVEFAAGLCLVLGFYRSIAAAVLAAFTVSATLMLVDFWRSEGPEREALRSIFTLNMAVIGGLLLAAIMP
jgi:putative oxidoreductase